MKTLWVVALAVVVVSLGAAPAQPLRRVDLATLAATWSGNFSVRGMKTEPTFIEDVQYDRSGDRFTLHAAINGQDLGVLTIDLDATGQISVVDCPDAGGCPQVAPNGFLSTVAVLSALRAGRLRGQGEVVTYAGRAAVCVPLEAIQAERADDVVMDPCVDLQTGAVLAHRRRFDNLFGGASLDESSLVLTTTDSAPPARTPAPDPN